jgi:DNA-binding PadR family transcriptional regulator
MANVILGLLLSIGPQTIYDLNKQFEAGVSLFYRASLGALRTALAGLLDRGEVSVVEVVEGGRAKKRYSVTDAGRDAFDTWMRDPITASDAETAAMSKTFFLALVPALDERVAIIDGIIDRVIADAAALDALAERLDALEIPAEHAEHFRFQRATLAYGIGAHQHAIEFFRALREQVASSR